MTRKHVAYNLAGASILLTATIVWLSGVDVADILVTQAEKLGETILAAGRFPVMLPVWAVALLCFPSIWLTAATARAIMNGMRHVGERFQMRRLVRAQRRANETAAEQELPCAETDTPKLPLAAAPAPDGYREDAVFGVVWRWFDTPAADELRAHCPACDEALVPWANGGSLSRGLHCERCNKLRAAGEHPDEIPGKVADTLAERQRSDDYQAAARRVESARSAATRPLASLPAA